MTITDYIDLGFNLMALICLIILSSLILVVGVYHVTLVIGNIYFDLVRFFDSKGQRK
jgi:hypothetical protein